MARSEAQKRAERARNERVVTITIRLSPDEAKLLDAVRGNISRQSYTAMAVMDYAGNRAEEFGEE